MAKLYEFQSETELIELLGQNKTQLIAKKYFSAQASSIEQIVKEGVAGNTFRAFRNLPVQPSVVFREWATSYINHSLAELSISSNQKNYSAYVNTATLALCLKWKNLTQSEIGYGRAAKLFNLVLKKFACYESLSQTQKVTLVSLQHVPLDSYTIIGLRIAVPEFKIPRGATMKYIVSAEQYSEFQQKIRDIAKQANVPPIYYDVLAWDMSHR